MGENEQKTDSSVLWLIDFGQGCECQAQLLEEHATSKLDGIYRGATRLCGNLRSKMYRATWLFDQGARLDTCLLSCASKYRIRRIRPSDQSHASQVPVVPRLRRHRPLVRHRICRRNSHMDQTCKHLPPVTSDEYVDPFLRHKEYC